MADGKKVNPEEEMIGEELLLEDEEDSNLVELTDEDGNVVDSCSGFIGDDLEKNGMLNYICDYIEK